MRIVELKSGASVGYVATSVLSSSSSSSTSWLVLFIFFCFGSSVAILHGFNYTILCSFPKALDCKLLFFQNYTRVSETTALTIDTFLFVSVSPSHQEGSYIGKNELSNVVNRESKTGHVVKRRDICSSGIDSKSGHFIGHKTPSSSGGKLRAMLQVKKNLKLGRLGSNGWRTGHKRWAWCFDWRTAVGQRFRKIARQPRRSQEIANPSLGWTKLHWLCSIGATPFELLDLVASLYPDAITMPDRRCNDTLCILSVDNPKHLLSEWRPCWHIWRIPTVFSFGIDLAGRLCTLQPTTTQRLRLFGSLSGQTPE